MTSKLGFSKGMISAVEREDSPVSKNLVESYIKNYPLYKNKLIKSYLSEFLQVIFLISSFLFVLFKFVLSRFFFKWELL